MDDENTICLMFSYHPDIPLSKRRRKLYREGARGREPGHMTPDGALPFNESRPYGRYWPKLNKRNNYGLDWDRSEEHTSELQSLMLISYAVFCSKKKKNT